MDFHSHSRKIDFYDRDSGRGKVLRTMTLNDISYWASSAFINVVLILFVLEFIDGGSATHLGLAFLVYKGVQAALSVPVGRFFDTHCGYRDELWGLAFASFATGALYVALSFATDLWHLYVAMIALGVLSTINISSWRILFYNNVEKETYGETVGIYQSIMSIGEGVAIALGGFFGDTFGFDTVVFYGGIVIALGGLLPFGVRCFVSSK